MHLEVDGKWGAECLNTNLNLSNLLNTGYSVKLKKIILNCFLLCKKIYLQYHTDMAFLRLFILGTGFLIKSANRIKAKPMLLYLHPKNIHTLQYVISLLWFTFLLIFLIKNFNYLLTYFSYNFIQKTVFLLNSKKSWKEQNWSKFWNIKCHSKSTRDTFFIINNILLLQLLQYNVPNGKKNRGLATILAYKMVEKQQNLTPENIHLANIMGWCIEMVRIINMYLI